MYRVFVTQAPMIDIGRLEDWLLEHDALYGLELGAALADASNMLVDYPERSPKSRDGRYRKLYVTFHSNQYVIRYRVKDDRVTIARIHHSLERR